MGADQHAQGEAAPAAQQPVNAAVGAAGQAAQRCCPGARGAPAWCAC